MELVEVVLTTAELPADSLSFVWRASASCSCWMNERTVFAYVTASPQGYGHDGRVTQAQAQVFNANVDNHLNTELPFRGCAHDITVTVMTDNASAFVP